MEKRKKITVLVPCFNEEGNIAAIIGKLRQLAEGKLGKAHQADAPSMTDFNWEWLFVNDGSTDRTLEMLNAARAADERVNILNLSRNFGKEAAMMAGLEYAGGDAVVIVDADLQHPLETVPEMVYWWSKGGYDDVYGQRTDRGRESWLRRRFSLAFHTILSRQSRVEILQNVGDFRLLSRRSVNALRALPETQRYTKGLFCWIGFSKKGVPFRQTGREKGTSKFNFHSLLELAIEGITSFTTTPLRISSVVGLLAAFCAIIYGLYIAVKTIFYGDPVAGFPTLVCLILFLGGLQLMALGIIGEYIARIFNETKKRPPYIVESLNGHTPDA